MTFKEAQKLENGSKVALKEDSTALIILSVQEGLDGSGKRARRIIRICGIQPDGKERCVTHLDVEKVHSHAPEQD